MAGILMRPVRYPTIGHSQERRSLLKRFEGRLSTNPALTSRIVSYRGNYDAPGFRWMKYREGFSRELIEGLLDSIQPDSVLDPFSGIGTAPIIAAGKGLRATGIEILPVGVLAGEAIALAANSLQKDKFTKAVRLFLYHIDSDRKAAKNHAFPHVRISEAAFPDDTELALAKAREFICSIDDSSIHTLLNLACMSVLESVSFTRKDGQYLRWDARSGKQVRSKMRKRSILTFSDAIIPRLNEMSEDIETLKRCFGRGVPELITGSSLEQFRQIMAASFDMVITSPPYANRYDYTRTYALELAWLGYDDEEIKKLRQSMLSATVENKPKKAWLQDMYGNDRILNSSIRMFENQGAVHEVIGQLKGCERELSNPHIVRMLEGYFFEMAVVVAELGRIVRPGGIVLMVNDNVQYHGEELPVDLILSDYAENSGFTCENIWVLPRGKGNASQQMGRFGRREQRKCVYKWVRKSG